MWSWPISPVADTRQTEQTHILWSFLAFIGQSGNANRSLHTAHILRVAIIGCRGLFCFVFGQPAVFQTGDFRSAQ
jgi:hypothetical protein